MKCQFLRGCDISFLETVDNESFHGPPSEQAVAATRARCHPLIRRSGGVSLQAFEKSREWRPAQVLRHTTRLTGLPASQAYATALQTYMKT